MEGDRVGGQGGGGTGWRGTGWRGDRVEGGQGGGGTGWGDRVGGQGGGVGDRESVGGVWDSRKEEAGSEIPWEAGEKGKNYSTLHNIL